MCATAELLVGLTVSTGQTDRQTDRQTQCSA